MDLGVAPLEYFEENKNNQKNFKKQNENLARNSFPSDQRKKIQPNISPLEL